MGEPPGTGAPNHSSSGQEAGKRMLCCWLWRAWSEGQMTNGWAKWGIRLEIDFGQGSFDVIGFCRISGVRTNEVAFSMLRSNGQAIELICCGHG